MPKVSRQPSNILDDETTYKLGTLFCRGNDFHTLFCCKNDLRTLLFRKNDLCTLLCRENDLHTLFLSRNDLRTLFCRESGLRTFYCECFLRTLFCRKKNVLVFFYKTNYALRLESFCLLKFAIPKAQTFWASAIHIQQHLLNKAKKFL